ncbi:Ig-like domain-containing domain [Vaginella massiliensis]|uniref:Ig-like domain-containing domain n=1 Tax=Vaginella massiliensis TaxID=1816680 RepID=UPI00374FE905
MKLNASFFFYVFCILFVGCARIGTPSGGTRDVDPPVFLGSFPDTLSTNVDPNIKEITLDFDEYIVLRDYSKNSVISPPFERNPIVSPQGTANKKITIKLQEPLKPNTTYNFNFGDAVRDNNEGNILSNFSYVFSTGNYIDSLQLSGRVKDSYQRKQPEKILVGLYKWDEYYNDSLIIQKKPYYITRADADGNYTLKYLAEGDYRLMAFADDVENNQFDFGKEKIAFHTQKVNLNKHEKINLTLFPQKPNYRAVRAEQKGYGQLLIKTEGLQDSIKITPIEKSYRTALIEQFPNQDSIVFWFNPKIDTLSNRNQRLKFELDNQGHKNELTALYSEPKEEFVFKVTTNVGTTVAPNQPVKLIGNAPIVSWNKADIELFRDSIQIPFEVRKNPKNRNELFIDFEKDYDQHFEINLYPKAIQNIFSLPHDTIVYKFATGKSMDFGNLKLTIANLPTKPFILQFLKRDKDQLVEEFYGNQSVFEFKNLEATEYYFRLLVDENENGKWDSGDVLKGIQPESAYIYPSLINIRKMWDADETWILGELKEEETKEPIRRNIPNPREGRGIQTD